MPDAVQNMALFQDLIRCGCDIYTWCYDIEGQLLESNCPQKELFSTAFSILGCKDRMLAHCKEHANPITLGSSLGLIWGAAFEQQDGQPFRAWVIGPFFYTNVSVKSIWQGFQASISAEVSVAWKHQFIQALYQVPTQHYVVHGRYLLMLHYCLTGERLAMNDLGTTTVSCAPEPAPALPQHDRHKVWAAEKAMLDMVRLGDLDYKDALHASELLSSGVPVQSSDPLRQGKISGTVFCSIVCRAAIEGGLSPEEAYALGDAYIQSTENAHTVDDLVSIPLAMYDDFIRRVHKLRTNPKLSVPVQKCVDYIEMHLSERIRAADLAAIAGYEEYYLTHKFREETGLSVSNYIKFAKIERAKVLLRTGQSIQEIAAALGFSSRSHFSQSFRDVVGISPLEFREQK